MNKQNDRRAALAKAEAWWRTLSINEGKALCVKHKAVVINGWPLASWLIEMYQENTTTTV